MRAPVRCLRNKSREGQEPENSKRGQAPHHVFCACACRAFLSVPVHHYVATQLYEVDQVVTDLLGECTAAGAGVEGRAGWHYRPLKNSCSLCRVVLILSPPVCTALAADVLHVGGRLVYWLPTPGDGEGAPRAPLVVPAHPALRVVSVSQQAVRMAFNRALVCMEKTCENTPQMRRQYEEEQANAAAAAAASAALEDAPTTAAPSNLASSLSSPTTTTAATSTPPISANHAKRLNKVAFRQQRKAMQSQAAAATSAAPSTSSAPAGGAQ